MSLEKDLAFKRELQTLINKHCKENGSNTPDFILAEYIHDCLKTFERIIVRRDEWHDFEPKFWDEVGEVLHKGNQSENYICPVCKNNNVCLTCNEIKIG